MFKIQYETWKNICTLYFDIKSESQRAYLQWFPFTKLSEQDKQYIVSESFFYQFIQNPAFLINPAIVHQSENFLQKSDGSFRDSSLIAPVLYLILQCIGKEISYHYQDMRQNNVTVYYAGNYSYDRVIYRTDYSDFYKHINAYAENYNYFIKTDITNFYNNINVDILMDRIDKVCNADNVCFSQPTLQVYKSFLLYCGHGRFPLIENSVASSFLATVVYLDEIDQRLSNYLETKIDSIQDFQMVRYVDDLYIMFSSSADEAELTRIYNEIRNVYSSILKEFGLTINAKKCCWRKTTHIHEELKTLLYNEYYNGIKGDIERIFEGKLSEFLGDLYLDLVLDSVDNETYNSMVEKHFSSDKIEFTAQEVLNYYIYDNTSDLQSEKVQNLLLGLVQQSNSFISLDPKRLTIMIMRSGNDIAIKAFLNNLFIRDRSDKWNSYDTTVAINYLIQSGFKHIDLLNVIEKRSPML
jgi:AbiA family abortive infection protein